MSAKSIRVQQDNVKHELRLPRFKAAEIGADFCMAMGHNRYRISDISESGFSLDSNKDFSFENDAELSCRILHNDQACIFEGRVERIRTNGSVVAFRFLDYSISRKLFEAIEDISSIHNAMQLRLVPDGLPMEYKALLIDMRDYLSCMKKDMDELDDRVRVEASATKDSYLTALDLVVFPHFMETMLSFSRRLNEIDKKFDENQRGRAKDLFRSHVREFYEQSDFVTRSLRRPLGYAGDFVLMNKIYSNEYVGYTTFSKLMYKWGINEISSQAVRYRRGLFVERLKKLSGKDAPRVASVACGPAQEVADFLQTLDKGPGPAYEFFLLDQDHQALLEAKRNLIGTKLNRQLSTEFHFLPVSVRDIIERNTTSASLEGIGFDLIYSAGLYDYLTQKAAKYLTDKLFQWLTPGGSLIVGNYNRLNPSNAIGDYTGDWSLILRSEEEMLDLVPAGASHKVHYDDHKVNIYLEVIRDGKG